jgi:hypothetical protein
MSAMDPRNLSTSASGYNVNRIRASALLVAMGSCIIGLSAVSCSSADPIQYPWSPGAQSTGDMPSSTSTSTNPPPNGPPPTQQAIDSGAPPATHDAGAAEDAGAAHDAGSDAPLQTNAPIVSFTLIDTSQNTGVNGTPVPGYDPLPDKSTITLGALQLSVRANIGATPVGSIGFMYDAINHTENAAPYMLCGDDGAGNIVNCNLLDGTHTLTAQAYSAADLGGTPLGAPLTITFTLVQ